MKQLSEIHLRDPFILPVDSEQRYYLYGTTGETAWVGKPSGFDVYISQDRIHWEGPKPAFRPSATFWADRHYWAPEVHELKGKYYMFASFKSEMQARATQILVADHPVGPFVPHGDGPVTPSEWECLDGILYVDRDGIPWIIFCHEWLQVQDGKMCAVRLSEDLKGRVGDVITLFRASEAPWVHATQGNNYVTDGPFLYRSNTGELLLLWSSHGTDGYAMGIARSLTGEITGPWIHEDDPIYKKDGGHGMLFRSFEGGHVLLTIHVPNLQPDERPQILNIRDEGNTLVIL